MLRFLKKFAKRVYVSVLDLLNTNIGAQSAEGPADYGSSFSSLTLRNESNAPIQRQKHERWGSSINNRALDRIANLAMRPAGAFIPLESALKSISILYDQYQHTTHVRDKIELLCSRIITLTELFETSADGENEKMHRDRLLLKFQAVEEKMELLRFVNAAYNRETVNRVLEDLHEAVGDYLVVQQLAIYNQGCTLMEAVERLTLNSFRRAKGAEYRHGRGKGCLKGTRGTVLNTIELWAKDPCKPPIYWLNGLAGTGKSAIARTIADRLFADGQLGASFFCSRDFEDRRDLSFIFPTLAIQLARKYSEFRSILVPLIRSDPEIAEESLYNQMNKLIVQPINKTDISTVIVIDALDECDDEEPASAILSVLGQLSRKIPKVKFFLTGRPELRIIHGFRLPLLAKISDIFILHNVKPREVDSDIRLFLRTGFTEIANRQGKLDNWPTEEQLDRLCKRAAGLFVYAAATIKFVSNHKKDPRKQLDRLLASEKIGAHEEGTLDALYKAILQEAFCDDELEDEANTRSILGAVVLAVNPLSPSTIATLFGFDTEAVSLSLSLVHSLLILQEDANHPVQFFHKSFPDFITDPKRCRDHRFLIFPPDHHLQLLIRCLNLMNRALEKNMCKLPDAVANSDVSDLKERIDEYIDPALQYACLSWHVHLAGADVTPPLAVKIIPTLHKFLEENFLFWLEVLSVLDNARRAVEALQITRKIFQDSSTLILANDCFRFITGYFEIINASARHIYHSALVFAPKESIVRKLYESHAHPFTRVVSGLSTVWDTNIAVTRRFNAIKMAAWSPCGMFIAMTWDDATTVDVLDSMTLLRLQALELPRTHDISMKHSALVFSPDSRILSCVGITPSGRGVFVVSWDLQTGAASTRWEESSSDIGTPRSVVYLANGEILGARCWDSSDNNIIFFMDIASGVTHSHRPVRSIPHEGSIWADRESLRFTTIDTSTITIWEIKPTLGATPTVVETLSAPEGGVGHSRFLPSQYRLGFVCDRNVAIWDARNSECLLRCTNAIFDQWMSFSPDGSLFACSTLGFDIYLWKESSTGYVLLQILDIRGSSPCPLISSNGESIVAFASYEVRLWLTEGFIPPSSTFPPESHESDENFLVDFSLDGTLVVCARQYNDVITVLNLKSGITQLTVHVGLEICSLRVVGKAFAVVGNFEVITTDLPVGCSVVDAKVTFEHRAQSIFDTDIRMEQINATISPDSHYIAVTTKNRGASAYLRIYDGSFGKELASRKEDQPSYILWFSPDGCDLWAVNVQGEGRVFGVGCGQEMLKDLGLRVDIEHPPEGYPWASARGYSVTDSYWVLGPDRKRLLMLPPPWHARKPVRRVWNGRFLVLLHGELPEPVILELLQ